MHNANWDDIRYVLAVAESGSVSAAAKVLGVNHATVLRRVVAFEEASGGPVFERSAQGYRLRPDRASVIVAARDAARAMQSVQRLMQGGDPAPGAVLRLTSVDSLCQTVLTDIFATLAARVVPHRLALVSSNLHLDLARLQADLTVRPAQALPGDMLGERVCDLGFGVYDTSNGANGNGAWLGMCGPLSQSQPARWFDANVSPAKISGRADSFVVLAKLAAAGQGRAILPCILGDRAEGLDRIDVGFPAMGVPLWVAHHRDLAGNRRILALHEAVTDVLRDTADQLRG